VDPSLEGKVEGTSKRGRLSRLREVRILPPFLIVALVSYRYIEFPGSTWFQVLRLTDIRPRPLGLGGQSLRAVEALKRYRSRGDQTVRVEHVTVNEGGQAIVGNVRHGGRGSPGNQETTP